MLMIIAGPGRILADTSIHFQLVSVFISNPNATGERGFALQLDRAFSIALHSTNHTSSMLIARARGAPASPSGVRIRMPTWSALHPDTFTCRNVTLIPAATPALPALPGLLTRDGKAEIWGSS